MPKLIIITFLGLLLLLNPICAESKILFYTPESNINNYTSLKTAFDSYLKSPAFQPFRKLSIFQQHLAKKPNGVMIISHWIYDNLKKTYKLTPLLMGTRQGKSTQKIFLFSLTKLSATNPISGTILASASDENYTKNLLKELINYKNLSQIQHVDILPVPKDIDALMSLTFGMADAALTTQKSYELFIKTNPQVDEILIKFPAEGISKLPIIAGFTKKSPNQKQLLNNFENMNNSAQGKQILNMVGLDDWKNIE